MGETPPAHAASAGQLAEVWGITEAAATNRARTQVKAGNWLTGKRKGQFRWSWVYWPK